MQLFGSEHLGTKYFKLRFSPQSRSAYSYVVFGATGFSEMKQISNMKLQGVAFGIAAFWFIGMNANADEVSEAIKASMVSRLGTVSVRFEPNMDEGKLSGCDLVFSALAVDNKYKVGDYLIVGGSIGIQKFKGNLGAHLKLVVNRIDFDTAPISSIPSPPSRAYLIKSDFSTTQDVKHNNFPAKTPGGLFSTFDAATGLDFISHSIVDGKLTIGFNQDNGNSDIVTVLELDVADTDNSGNRKHSGEATIRFSECIQSVADSIK